MAETAAQPPLSDLMMAMDVVDTLRHGETLVGRELSAEQRRAKMIERLREVYRGQGIAVSDRILEEGVAALEEERFIYKPRSGGFAFTLARLYVRRDVLGRRVGIIGAIVLAVIAGWFFLIQQPGERRAGALRIELAETIPARLSALSANVVAEAIDPAIDARAELTARDGTAAAAAGNADAARAAVTSLEALLAELRLIFEARIVSRPGAVSGVTRIPPNNPGVENFYLIVEAIGPDGRAIPRSITSEEDGTTRTVTQWGVRVPESVFNAAVADKENDGIIQDALLGRKVRGELEIDWVKPTLGGTITNW